MRTRAVEHRYLLDTATADLGTLREAIRWADSLHDEQRRALDAFRLPDARATAAAERAESIRQRFAAVRSTNGNTELGSIFRPNRRGGRAGGQSSAALVEMADSALYRAKRNGRGRVELASGTDPGFTAVAERRSR